ncbi:response regulator [Pararhodobacter marinus]|uniref:response regulator n=1 Tax=Pararhodobacter marinus TaxID=2184063 RepID=UPI003517E2F6
MNSLPHILVVDDHRQIRDSVARFLERNGMRATAAKDARDMDEKLAKGHFDLMVLDVMMPGEDGLSICKRLSAEKRLPIIMLTALGQDQDRIVGLEIGADDYLPKPFNPRELLARIRAVLRRTPQERHDAGDLSGRILYFDGLTLDTDTHVLTDRDGNRMQLTTADFRLLTVLLARPRTVLSREQLLDLTAGRAAGPLDRTIDNQISRLRRKIEMDPLRPTLITTIRSQGYSLNTDVEVVA